MYDEHYYTIYVTNCLANECMGTELISACSSILYTSTLNSTCKSYNSLLKNLFFVCFCSFYDVTLGYDPNRFIPPANCQ